MEIFEEEKSIASLLENDKSTSSIVGTLTINNQEISKTLLSTNLISIQNVINGDFNPKIKAIASELSQLEKGLSKEHPDLLYCSSILVSTTTNANDDVFLPEETWQARYTPVNTPYNNEHDEVDIIGHIFASRCLNSDGSIISDGSSCPNYFDIEVDSVVYKYIFPEVAAEIIEKAPRNEKFVSMECIFKGFDYALFDSNDQMQVVKRNKSTAFLTKYLRIYKGPGTYEGKKIGRVLRGIKFVGMACVDNPANKRSKFTFVEKIKGFDMEKTNTTEVTEVKDAKAEVIETKTVATEVVAPVIEKIEASEVIVTDVATATAKISEDLTKANQTIEKLTKELAEAKALASTEVEKAKAGAEEYMKEVQKQFHGAYNHAEKLKDAEAKIQGMTSTMEAMSKEMKGYQDQLAKIEKDKKTTSRVSAFERLGFSVDEKKKEDLGCMADDVFDAIVKHSEELKSKIAEKNKDKADDVDPAMAEKSDKSDEKPEDKLKTEKEPDGDECEGKKSTASVSVIDSANVINMPEEVTNEFRTIAAKIVDEVYANKNKAKAEKLAKKTKK